MIRAASESLVWVSGLTSARPVHVFMVCAVGRIMRKTMVQAAANYKEQGSYYGSIEMTTDTQLRERGKTSVITDPLKGNSLQRKPSKRTLLKC